MKNIEREQLVAGEVIPCYTLSELKWTQDVLFLPDGSRSVPLRYLAYNSTIPGDQRAAGSPLQKVCRIYHVWTGETIIEVAISHDEGPLFSELQTQILKAKLGRR